MAELKLTETGYEVIEDDAVYEAIHTSGKLSLCQLDGNESFDCAVFHGPTIHDSRGEVRLVAAGDRVEIDGYTYEATGSSGWVPVSE